MWTIFIDGRIIPNIGGVCMNRNKVDMINGPLLKNVILFALPLMFSNVLQLLFNAADIVVVGRFAGEQALAAVGATSSICFLLVTVFNGLSIGANVVIARNFGANNDQKIHDSVHTAMMLSVIGGFFLLVIGQLFSKPLLHLMDTPEDIIELSALYLRIYFAGMPGFMIYNFGSSILRAKGDTKRPMIFLTVSGILNVVLNLIFVIYFHMSVAGVALATMISQLNSAILVWNVLIHEQGALKLYPKELKIEKETAVDILKIGLPAGVQGMVFSLSNVVVQSSVNTFGSIVVAGNSAANNIEGFVYNIMNAFYQACMTFTGQNIGAKRYDRINKILITCMILIVIAGITAGLSAHLFSDFFLGLYTEDPSVIAAGKIRLSFVALFYVFNGTLDIFVGSLRGMGKASVPTLLSIFGICGVRLLWIWTVFPIQKTLSSIYVAFPLSWSITTVLQMVYWFVQRRKLDQSIQAQG